MNNVMWPAGRRSKNGRAAVGAAWLCDSASLFLTCLFSLSCKCETVWGKEKFYYKYECRRDKLSVLTHSGKRQESLYISV